MAFVLEWSEFTYFDSSVALCVLCAFLAITFGSLFHFLQSILDFLQVGMFVVFAGLVAVSERQSSKVVKFMQPGVDLLTSFLPAFFIPALVVAPLSLANMSG